jgi:hypothetical protein
MKEFQVVDFDPHQCRKELEEFSGLLRSKTSLSERDDLQPLFARCHHLTSYIGTTFGLNIGIARQIAYQFELFGDYAADIVIGNREKQFCFIELEDGRAESVLARVGKKSTKEWGRNLEHGFSQLVDWFCLLDDLKKTDRFQRNFGYGQLAFVGLLLIGRDEGLDDDDIKRFRWRAQKVVVDSHPIICMTFDDLYEDLKQRLDLYAAAFQIEKS